ncbi:hypothetical protein TNCV_4873951 [Trichonephila clavipes]|nr:hypothetical protein TNCV_4873951 [Trichonephila clavipes]
MMIRCDTTPDDFADAIMSNADVLNITVSVTPTQPSAMKWGKDVHLVDKFLTAATAARTFAKLCLYVAGDNLLLGMTTQLHPF